MRADSANIAFIVPAYNVEAYLNECLTSIVQASAPGDEVILIDDGSQDGTNMICRRWRALHPQLITLIEQSNQGLSAARNQGLAVAKVAYVLFMDSDDVVLPDAVSEARQTIEALQPDVVVMDFDWWHPQCDGQLKHSPRCSHPARSLLTDRAQFLIETYRDGLLSACSRIFKRTLFQSLSPDVFPVGKTYEEIATVPRLIMRANSLYYLDKALFHYRVRDGSITRSKTLRHCVDLAAAMDKGNKEAKSLSDRHDVHMASNMAAARFVAKALQDCALVPQAGVNTYAQTWQAAQLSLTEPIAQLLASLRTSHWPEAEKAAKHLSQAHRQLKLYAMLRLTLQRWRQWRERGH